MSRGFSTNFQKVLEDGLIAMIFHLIAFRIRGAVLSQVIADDQGSAHAQRDEAGEKPGAEMKRRGSERWREHEPNWIETQGQGQTNHTGDQAGTQQTDAPAFLPQRVRIKTTGDQCHAFSMLNVAQKDDEAKEDGQSDEPTE